MNITPEEIIKLHKKNETEKSKNFFLSYQKHMEECMAEFMKSETSDIMELQSLIMSPSDFMVEFNKTYNKPLTK